MKNATPETDKAISATIKLIEELNYEYLFQQKSIYRGKSDKEVSADYGRIKSKVVNLYENVLFDDVGLEKIKNEVFLRVETMMNFDRGTLLVYINILKKVVSKKLSKKEKAKAIIQGLIKPVKWGDITLIFNGSTVKVKQNSKSLGEYSLSDLGMPKITKKGGRSVPRFFMCLFISQQKQAFDFLSSSNNTNQKHKGKLSEILKNAFGTAIDPIYIDDKSHQYTSLFKVSFGGELSINDHRSGGALYDETKPTNQDYD